MKVTVISSNDRGGGGLAASRLHEGLVAAGVDSNFFCRSAAVSLPRQLRFCPPGGKIAALNRFVRKWKKRRFELNSLRESSTLWGADHLSRFGGTCVDQIPEADVLNLHSVFDLLDYDAFFQAVNAKTLIVWTLHQMNAFTGGCTYSQGCRQFEQNCGQCPYLKPTSDRVDASHQVWQSKQASYSRIPQRQLIVVSPSKWLANCAAESSLFGNRAIHVIPNGLDLSLFRPHRQDLARDVLGIPHEARVVLFVSQYDRRVKIKGFVHLEKAISMLSGSSNLLCLSVGPASGDNHVAGVPLIEAGAVDQQWMMPLIYSAADLLVVPSLEDNFPNVILEAAACGVPAVASNVGGIPEMVDHGLTGLLVPNCNSQAITEAVRLLIDQPDTRKRMGVASRAKCEDEFSMEIQVRRYQEVFTSRLNELRGNGASPSISHA